MQEGPFVFTQAVLRGRVVDLHYLPAAGAALWPRRTEHIPYFTVPIERYEQLQREAPGKFKQSPFRIVRNYGSTVSLEWTTT